MAAFGKGPAGRVRPIADLRRPRQVRRVSEADPYFLADVATEVDLAAWADVLPSSAKVLGVTLFADIVLGAGDGAVYLLEVSACTCSQIATSEAEFWGHVRADEDGWQLRPLAEECRRAGKQLGRHQCYAFTQMPVFGGDYRPENIWVCSLQEWLSFTGEVFRQTQGLPDGAIVELRVVD